MVSPVSDADSDRCIRCGGLTVVEDLCGGRTGSPGSELTVRRCVICGDVVDPVILEHRTCRAAEGRTQMVHDVVEYADDSFDQKEKA